ncbi:ATP-binding protein [Paraconexibacter antarcticus]|uniref:ATP-binding protein n=1 Tax=Paraconexibacter antarcticus TaxID=2949664 RepID=A0ABY5DVU3_9ACTN|nr:ATP-binding protein [Paraconexibacter antarcticus]UTI66138.1 ATP-binding protein [Paraconexibacter antarcticus]
MSQPLTFAYRNVLFGRDARDAWALFRVHTSTYAGLSTAAKIEQLGRLAAFASAVESDFQILRVTRTWSGADYAEAARATLDELHGFPAKLEDLIDGHARTVAHDAAARPEVFLVVSLAAEVQSASLRGIAQRLAGAVGLADARGISAAQLTDCLDRERHAFGRAADYLDVERASTHELQWLLRRTALRGLGEPWLDRFWRPQALILDRDDEDGGLRFEPTHADLVSLLDVPMTERRDHLEIGEAVQTVLIAGALPEITVFPGRQAELLFSPLEGVGFPVDASFSARVLSNERALALVRKRIVDADHAFRDESHGDHGPTARTAERPDLARELEEQLSSTARPPLLRAQLSLAVSAPSIDELDDRVRLLRREFAPIALHRPKDVQLRLWQGHLPAQRPSVRRYDDVLLPEQFGAMVPTATHAVGARAGLLVGHTLSGSRQPVLFDVTEGSRTSRPPAVLCTGTPGSGKTVTAQLLAYQAFTCGSQVVDLDPKGDHHLASLVGAEHVEEVELSASGEFRGMLDPLRIAPEDLRVELAYSFLTELLPAPVPPQWQTEIRAAVAQVAGDGGQSCGLVLDALDRGGEDARAAAHAIEVHAASGLLQLGFAARETEAAALGTRPVVSLRIANLTLPSPGTPKIDLTQEERTGRALLRLLAVQALHLAGSDWSRHKVVIVEELSQLVGDAIGLALIQRIVRMCRSQNATPILVTQVVDDVAAVADMVGCFFAFGVETDTEARRVLTLLGLDPEDPGLRGQLRSFRRGRCLMRDYEGRVSPIQVDLADPHLLDALDTTPRRAAR